MRLFLTGWLLAIVATGCTTGDSQNESAPLSSVAVANVAPAGSVADSVPQPSARGIQLPQFERVKLQSGAVLLLAEKRDVPLVALRATLRGGAVADPAGKAGVAMLTAALLEKGAGERDARDFAETVAAVGGSLSASSGVEGVQIGGEFLADDVDLMIELLSDMLLRPRFDAGEFDKLRRRSIQLIKSAKDSDPRQLIGSYGSAFVFAGHPYGRPAGGDETSLARIDRQDVLDYYARHFGGDRLILAVVGDFDSSALKTRLNTIFGEWRGAGAALPIYADQPEQDGQRILLVDKPDATQTYFWLGNTGVSKAYEGRGSLDVVNTVFGGRFTSMLNTALRIESGLTYGARSRVSRPQRNGSVALVSFTATETTVEAIDLAIATLEKLHGDGLSDTQAVSAKNYILGQNPLGFETSSQIAAQLATLEFYGLDRGYIDDYAKLIVGASPAQISAVIGDVYPTREELVMVMIGNADAIRESISKYGQVTEISITSPVFFE